MRFYDVSFPLHPGMPAIPGDPPIAERPLRSLARGDPYSLTQLTLSTHAGTHLDPPAHFVPGGMPVDEIPVDTLVGPCEVIEVPPGRRAVLASDMRGPTGGARLLFRTANSARWAVSEAFFPEYVGLTGEAARALARDPPKLIGIDSLSIENDPTGRFPVHRALASAGVVVLEGLRLGEVPAGHYELICLPLRVRGGDGAPARVLLREA